MKPTAPWSSPASSPSVARVFEITGLDRIFTIHGSLAEIGVTAGGGGRRDVGQRARTSSASSSRSEPDFISTARLFAGAAARYYGCDEDAVQDVEDRRLEACTNAVKAHGLGAGHDARARRRSPGR